MMMRGKALATGILSGLGALVLATGLAQAHDDVTIRVAPPTYDVPRYYVAPPPVIVTPPPAQERVIVQEHYPAYVYSSPPPFYPVPPASGVFVGPSGVYIYHRGDRD
jgi:hypothetical protein